MELYPAIDLKDGKCIRLKKGKLDKITHYNGETNELVHTGMSGDHYIGFTDIYSSYPYPYPIN